MLTLFLLTGYRTLVCECTWQPLKTKPITLDVAYSGQSAGLNARAGLTAKARINRDDFGLGRGMMVQSAAGKTATVEIALVAVQKAGKESETVVKAR